MNVPSLSPAEIVERGSAIYDEQLRGVLEPSHNNAYVVIDIETGAYEVDRDHMAASDRARSKRPDGLFYATRVGSRTIGRVGGRWGAGT